MKETNGGAISVLSVDGHLPQAGGPRISNAAITSAFAASATRGAVQSFEIVSEQQQGQAWRVRLHTKLNKYDASNGDKLPKVVILPSRTHAPSYVIGDQQLSSEDAGALINSELSDAIGKSKRFSVIDRSLSDDSAAELNQLDDPNTSPAELAKLGQKLTADILIVPDITSLEYRKSSRTLHFTGRELRSYQGGLDVSFHVVNAATGKTILSKHIVVKFPNTPPSVNGSQKVGVANVKDQLGQLSNDFTRDFILKNFPISVVKLDGRSVVLSQGDPMLKAGSTYQAVMLGDDVKDPQTGQSLGRLETNVGTISISRTTDTMSFGTLNGSVDTSRFQPGSIELRDELKAGSAPPSAPQSVAASHAQTAPPKAPSSRKPLPKPKNADGFDDF